LFQKFRPFFEFFERNNLERVVDEKMNIRADIIDQMTLALA
jgi:hypothetical protein